MGCVFHKKIICIPENLPACGMWEDTDHFLPNYKASHRYSLLTFLLLPPHLLIAPLGVDCKFAVTYNKKKVGGK